jgi:hypothetical protein
MAAITVVTCTPVSVIEQITAPAGEAIALGAMVRFDVSTGYLTKANGTSAGEARACGIAVKAANFVNETITAVRKGVVDIGSVLGDLAYDADVYLSDTDGKLDTATGSTTLIVGQVLPGLGSTTPDKLLRVNL